MLSGDIMPSPAYTQNPPFFFTELNVLVLLWKHTFLYWKIGWKTGSGVVDLENGFQSLLCQLNERTLSWYWSEEQPGANEEKMKNCANWVPSALWWVLKGSGWLMRAEPNRCFILAKVDARCVRSWSELRSELFDFNHLPQAHTNFSDRENKCGSEIKDEDALIDVASLLASCVFCLRRAIRNSCDFKLLRKSPRLPDALWVTCSITPKQLRAKDANFICSSKTGIVRAWKIKIKCKEIKVYLTRMKHVGC